MLKILIIEDDTILSQTTSDFLEKEGYTVLQAHDGLNGIKMAMDELPDLILCDIALPHLDGYQVYKTLQQDSSTYLVPFIFLTAKTEKEDIRAGMHLGADDYITKPFDFDELLTAISTRIVKYQKIIDKSYENFYALLNNPLVGIYICQNDRIVFSNSKFAEILGYPKHHLDHAYFKDFIHPEDQKDFYSAVKKCERKIQQKFHLKFRLMGYDGHYLELESSGGITTLNNDQAILGMLEKSDGKNNNMDNFNHLEDLGESINFILSKKDSVPEGMAQKLIAELDNNGEERHEFKNKEGLTKREIEVLKYICRGMTNQEIAERLHLSYKTIDSHRTHLLEKTGSNNTAELVIYAIRNRVIDLQD